MCWMVLVRRMRISACGWFEGGLLCCWWYEVRLEGNLLRAKGLWCCDLNRFRYVIHYCSRIRVVLMVVVIFC